jgi:hypothetical protein
MNEIMKHPVRMPKIIKVDIPVNLAYRLRKMLENHSKDRKRFMDGALASHIAHKLWILLYQSKFSTQPTFTCLAGHWHSFCRTFVQDKLNQYPQDRELQKLLACISAGREVRSE